MPRKKTFAIFAAPVNAHAAFACKMWRIVNAHTPAEALAQGKEAFTPCGHIVRLYVFTAAQKKAHDALERNVERVAFLAATQPLAEAERIGQGFVEV